MATLLFHVSDLHFGREDQAALAWFAGHVRDERPAAVICTGDLTMRARPAEFAAACAWLKALAVPVTVEPGNHDLPYYNPFARMLNPYRRFRAVERAIARPLDLPAVLLVPLKTTTRIQRRRLTWGRVSRSGLPVAVRRLGGKAAGQVGLVACHHPLVRAGFTGHGHTTGGDEAVTKLAKAGADAVLSGHVHDAFDVVHASGVRLIGAGTLSRRLRSTPPSFNALTIEGGRLDVAAREMPARKIPRQNAPA